MSDEMRGLRLTKVQLSALAECTGYADRKTPYWWRRASMAKLEVAGLVARAPHESNPRLDSYSPTAAGRALLAQERTDGR